MRDDVLDVEQEYPKFFLIYQVDCSEDVREAVERSIFWRSDGGRLWRLTGKPIPLLRPGK